MQPKYYSKVFTDLNAKELQSSNKTIYNAKYQPEQSAKKWYLKQAGGEGGGKGGKER